MEQLQRQLDGAVASEAAAQRSARERLTALSEQLSEVQAREAAQAQELSSAARQLEALQAGALETERDLRAEMQERSQALLREAGEREACTSQLEARLAQLKVGEWWW